MNWAVQGKKLLCSLVVWQCILLYIPSHMHCIPGFIYNLNKRLHYLSWTLPCQVPSPESGWAIYVNGAGNCLECIHCKEVGVSAMCNTGLIICNTHYAHWDMRKWCLTSSLSKPCKTSAQNIFFQASIWCIHAAAGHRYKILQLSYYGGISACLYIIFHSLADIVESSKICNTDTNKKQLQSLSSYPGATTRLNRIEFSTKTKAVRWLKKTVCVCVCVCGDQAVSCACCCGAWYTQGWESYFKNVFRYSY